MTHTFHHPKYHKEMRAKRRKLQAASSGSEDLPSDKYQINYDDFCKGDEEEPQASSSKPQASSPKRQASSFKPEATSSMIRDPRNI